MGKKILFAVMALLVMATGKIWAEDTAEKKAYAVLHSNEDGTTYSMHFVNTTDNVDTGDVGEGATVEIKKEDGTTEKTLTYTKAWEIDPASIYAPAWNSATEKAKITEVVFMESFKDVQVNSCKSWFSKFTGLTDIIGIENLNTSKVTDMASMFYGCSSLTELDLSSFNTSMVQYMTDMFSNCSGLTSLDLSSFNTSMVQYMTNMFSNCSSLTSLNLSSFNTSMVQYMTNMFYGCSKLTSLTLGSFDMSQVTSADDMFDGCTKSDITINGNALVFVTSDAQKGVWNGLNNVNFVKMEGDTYKYNGNITIDYSTEDETAPVIFPHEFMANSVTFTRTFAADKPHTVCLPFAITSTTDYDTFYELSGYDNGKVKFKKVNATEANKPYLFIPKTAGVTEIEVTGGVDIAPTAGGGKWRHMARW